MACGSVAAFPRTALKYPQARKWAADLREFTLVALLIFVSSCSSRSQSPRQTEQPGTLMVSAASDLRFAFEELGKAFQEKTGTMVRFNFGSTGQLAQQIERGAAVDLFAAADLGIRKLSCQSGGRRG